MKKLIKGWLGITRNEYRLQFQIDKLKFEINNPDKFVPGDKCGNYTVSKSHTLIDEDSYNKSRLYCHSERTFIKKYECFDNVKNEIVYVKSSFMPLKNNSSEIK